MAIKIREEDRERASVEVMQQFAEECRQSLMGSKVVKQREAFSVSDAIRQLKHKGVTNEDYARKLLRGMVDAGTLTLKKEKGKNVYRAAFTNILKISWDKSGLQVLTPEPESV